LALAIIFSQAVFAFDIDDAVNITAAYVYNTISAPQVGSIGGEWAIIGLARSGYDVPGSYFEDYYKAVEKYVTDREGVLHRNRYTDYSRVILALTAIGYDPRNVGGYDLTAPLEDFDRTLRQGINGAVWALIALDSMNYTSSQRENYISEILSRQLSDGGWNLSAATGTESGDPSMTGMALQALAKYQDRTEVKEAVDKALDFLSENQDGSGGFAGWGSANIEDAVQVLVALCELGIDMNDPRFVKNGSTLADNILSFRNPDGGFRNMPDDIESNMMATEQALYGLAALQRFNHGKTSLYRMNTFSDIKNHANQTAIEVLASRGIINGRSEKIFDPDAAVTRAEFAAMITRALGLPAAQSSSVFADVPSDAWFSEAAGTAEHYGIISGISAAAFDPDGVITREEAAGMIARAAEIGGTNTNFDVSLSEIVTRAEIAEMIYQMLRAVR
jgi:hypothetical protein